MKILSPKQKKFLGMKKRGIFDAASDKAIKPPKGSKSATPLTPSRKNLFKL